MRADPVVATLAAVSALAVIDGDTFRIGAERYRLLGIDAAEIHRAQCDAERRLGELTRRRLEALAGSGQIDLRADRPGQRDRYGRLLVRLFVNGEDAACVLIKEGYARPWRGRREDWCVNIDPPESLAGIVCAASPPPRRPPLRIEPASPRPTPGPQASL